jgi:hypothetical protein
LAEDLGIKTLLLDADLAAGTIQFLLKLGSTASLVDALTHAENLDEDLWFRWLESRTSSKYCMQESSIHRRGWRCPAWSVFFL